ncbi:hypothetical protein P8A22_07585 [Streptomyces laculatispora]|uniref:Uncharacterized protein n=1 Tax=Streptomyces laculatispora TaxID=887464 RepID=A0ABY9IF65_9ACTN|nr:hypothetical protein [Streptomyces laculatispora]WLQ45578.1 hypothetical protein P8A22_07585 [Streptomyces laculatispora]
MAPLKGDPELTRAQPQIVDPNISTVRNNIRVSMERHKKNMAAEHGSALRDAVTALAQMVAGQDVPADGTWWQDSHARWELYRRAAGTVDAGERLLAGVAAESDLPLASAVVVMMLERVPAGERGRWMDVLDPEVRDFSREREHELAVLDALTPGEPHAGSPSAQEIAAWSDWLQLRVAGAARDRPLLELLADSGRTKRIRGEARQSAHRVRREARETR